MMEFRMELRLLIPCINAGLRVVAQNYGNTKSIFKKEKDDIEMSSKTILGEVDGFTPVIDSILKEHGVSVALVFGRVWRYCQFGTGLCFASIETIATDLGISYTTAFNAIKKLCESGHLEDTTPNLHNHPHSYRDTGKAGNMHASIGFGSITNIEHSITNIEHSITVIDEETIKETKEDINNISEQKIKKPLTASDCKKATEESMMRGIARNLSEDGDRINQYPEDVRPILSAVCELFNLKCPSIKSTHAGHWIKESRELKDACGEFEKQVLVEIANEFEQHKRTKGGTVPFPVTGPHSLVNSARGKAGLMRAGTLVNKAQKEMQNGYEIPRGARIVYIGGKAFIPGVGEVTP